MTREEAFDIQALLDLARELNVVADQARAAGWRVDIDGADYVGLKIEKIVGGAQNV